MHWYREQIEGADFSRVIASLFIIDLQEFTRLTIKCRMARLLANLY